MSETHKRSGDLRECLLLMAVEIVLALVIALVVIPLLLLVFVLVGVYMAGEWVYLRLTAAIARGGRRRRMR